MASSPTLCKQMAAQSADGSTHAPIPAPGIQPPPAPAKRRHLLAVDHKELVDWLGARGQKPFRLRQLINWTCQRKCTSFAEISVLPLGLRVALEEHFVLATPHIDFVEDDAGGTRKYRLSTVDGSAFEAVYIPQVAKGRATNTLCISSQTGCSVGCKFCFTASLKRHRNLTVDEILGQVLAVQLDLAKLGPDKVVTNIVFMGMGEPLLNYDNVVAATKLLLHDDAFAFAPRRVTISTSGIVPRLATLGHDVPVQLAISLNATTDAIRTEVMPINKKWPIATLIKALHDYPLLPRRRFTIEYVLLGGVNDTLADARRLVRLLDGLAVKVNLLPLNPHERTTYVPPDHRDVLAFQKVLLNAGLNVFLRTPRGQNISAACGQLGDTIGRPGAPQRAPQVAVI